MSKFRKSHILIVYLDPRREDFRDAMMFNYLMYDVLANPSTNAHGFHGTPFTNVSCFAGGEEKGKEITRALH